MESDWLHDGVLGYIVGNVGLHGGSVEFYGGECWVTCWVILWGVGLHCVGVLAHTVFCWILPLIIMILDFDMFTNSCHLLQ